MKYTTDYKWKPFREDMNGLGFRYRGTPYELNEFMRIGENLPPYWGSPFPCAPIEVHGVYSGSAFHSVLIEIDESNEMYRVCTVTT